MANIAAPVPTILERGPAVDAAMVGAHHHLPGTHGCLRVGVLYKMLKTAHTTVGQTAAMDHELGPQERAVWRTSPGCRLSSMAASF